MSYGLRRTRRCNRLHALAEFDGNKHTCVARLAEHNARRRKVRLPQPCGEEAHQSARPEPSQVAVKRSRRLRLRATAAEAQRTEQDDESEHGPSNCSVSAGTPPLSSSPLSSSSPVDASPLTRALLDGLFDIGDWLADERMASSAVGCNASTQPLAAAVVPFLDPALWAPGTADARALPWAAAAPSSAVTAALHSVTVHVKLASHVHDTAPAPAPASTEYSHAEQLRMFLPELQLPAALAHLFHVTIAAEPHVAAWIPQQHSGALTAAVRPGCTLITLHALLPSTSALPSATQLLQRVLETPGDSGAFLRAQTEISVRAVGGGIEATYRRDDASPGTGRAHTGVCAVAESPRLPPLTPLAVLSTAASTLTLEAEPPTGTVIHCRMASGRVLPLTSVAGERAHVVLPRCNEAGVALFEAQPPSVPLHHLGAPRPVLLTADAAIAAEVASTGDALRLFYGSSEALRTQVELVVTTLGAALSPNATPCVQASAATASLLMGWRASLSRLLQSPAFADDTAAAHARLLTLLCYASTSPHSGMMRVLVEASPLLSRGGTLAAALMTEASQNGNVRSAIAAASALDALGARCSAEELAEPDAAAAVALLRTIASAIDAPEAAVPFVRAYGSDGGATDAVGVAASDHEQRVSLAVHGLRSSALYVFMLYFFCFYTRFGMEPVSPDEVLAMMPCPSWGIWLRMPTAMCCSGLDGPVLGLRELTLLLTVWVAFMPGAHERRLRATYALHVHTLLTSYSIIIEPAMCALSTHSLYGAGIRQPWQGGVKQILHTFLAHVSSAQQLPGQAHIVLFAFRGVLPLLVRAAQLRGPHATAAVRLLGTLRALPAHAGWDWLHLFVCFACVLHFCVERSRRRRIEVQKDA